MNELALVTVPPEVATTTSCGPGVPAGNTAVICVGLTTLKLVAVTPPTVTLLAPVKFVPLIVIVVPAVMDPVAGVMVVIDGTASVEPSRVMTPELPVVFCQRNAWLSPTCVPVSSTFQLRPTMTFPSELIKP